MLTEQDIGEPEPTGKRRVARKFTDEQKSAILAELNDCATRKEVRDVLQKHRVQTHQVARWRAQVSGTKPAPTPVRRARVPAEPARGIGAKDVAAYLQSLETRIAAAERFTLKLSKLLGGK